MKIGPALPQPRPPQTAVPADLPSLAFSAYLEAPGGTREGPTFGFAELGMFGVSRALVNPHAALDRGRAPDPSQHLDAAPAETRPLADESGTPMCDIMHDCRGERLPGSIERSASMRFQHATESEPRIEAVATPDTPDDQPQAGIQSGDLADQTQPGGAERRGRFRQLAAALKSDVSLILSEKAGEVELIVRSPQLDPEARAALRHLARSILARNGLNLARFQLNGSLLPAASTTTMIGDPDGTRSR